MRLFRLLILRHLARQRARTAITIVSIALGIAAVLAIQLASAGAVHGFERALESLAGRAALEVTQAPRGVDERRLPALSWLQDYGQVTPIIQGDATWVGRDGSQEVLTVLGVDILTDQAFRDYAFSTFVVPDQSGNASKSKSESQSQTESESESHDQPRTQGQLRTTRDILALLTDSQSVVLTEKFAQAHGINVGDEVRFGMGDAQRVLRVRALLANRGAAQAMDGNIILMDIAAAQLALARLGYIDRLEIRLDDASRIERVETELTARLGSDFTVQRPARRGRQVEKMLSAFHANLTALSGIALIVGMFLVYNTVSTSVLDRRQEIGMLRAVGMSRAAIFGLFLGEALVLAIPGCALGLLLGGALARGAVALTSATVTRMYIATASAPPTLDAWQISLAFLVGIPLALLSAAAPAREAAGIPPTEAIRHTADVPPAARRVRWIVAAASFGGAAWLSTLGPLDGLPIGGYLAAFLIVVGTTAITLSIFAALAHAAMRLFKRLFVLECWLATHNLVEYARRMSVSVAALAVSLAMTVAIAVMVSSFRETVIYWVQQTLVADLFVGPMARRAGARDATVPLAVEQAVRAYPAVAAVDTLRIMTVPFQGAPVFVSAGDFAVLLDHGRLLLKSPVRGAEEAMRAAIGHDEVVVSEAFALRYRMRLGDAVTLPTPSPEGSHAFRIAAIYYDYTNDRGTVVLDRATFARHFGEQRPASLAVYLKPGTDADTARRDLARTIGAEQRIAITTNAALRAEVLRIFDSTFAITWALEVIAVTVAVLGIVATLITVIVERRRELAVLRLIGASRAQVQRMVVAEAAMLGGISQLLGLGVGLVLSLVLIYVINVQSFGWSIQFHVPFAFLAQLSIVLVIATAVAGLYPARRAAQTFITEQVGDE
jgi:putative ABC transport system permease protein